MSSDVLPRETDRAADRITDPTAVEVAREPTHPDATVRGPKGRTPPPREVSKSVGSWLESDLVAVLDIADDTTRAAALELLAKHLPGKHDQSSHGHGGGSGIRQSLRDAATVEDVEQVTAGELHRLIGHPVSVSFQGFDEGLARESAEGILRGAERFPNTRLGAVSTYGQGGLHAEFHDPLFEAMATTATNTRSSRGDEISMYAASDAWEMLSEAGADVLINGSGARSLSKELFAVIESTHAAGGSV